VLWHIASPPEVSGDRRPSASVQVAAVRLYFQLLVEKNFDAEAVLSFTKRLYRQLRAPMTMVWDRSNTHRTADIRDFFVRIGSCHSHFPSYAPELNPVEYVWSYSRRSRSRISRALMWTHCPWSVRHARSIQHQPHLLRSFIDHSPLSLRLLRTLLYAGLNSRRKRMAISRVRAACAVPEVRLVLSHPRSAACRAVRG